MVLRQVNSREARARVAFRPFRWLGASVLGMLPYETAAAQPGIRNAIHDTAFNLYQHAGNVAMSTSTGVLAGLVAGGLYGLHHQELEPAGAAKQHLRSRLVAVGLATGVVLNTLSETRWGMRVIHIPNTPDVWDAVYGTVAATAGAAIGIAVEEVRE
jgi:hypothetical protein